ncbi:hypothetical protein C1702_11225 [Caldimonas thermodepolymerans]|uniref:Phage tail tape measure protein n=1 Tax=Caldimonas thermodepolymerans TaxID=215580 RepID=A0A2S5T3H6_9BURK|nr:hypothetical protein C1702_11225 [Caldimonas thermodepolymerans]
MLAAVSAAAAAAGAALKKGFEVNAGVETATLGIKSLIASLTEVRDAAGTLATGPEKLAIAGQLAEKQMQKLRLLGLQTSATFEQLSAAYTQAIGAGSSAGLTLDESMELMLRITQAAAALGVPMEQLNQEVRSIISAQITADSTVGKALEASGVTSENLKAWREAGTLAEELGKRLETFREMSPETSATWTATLSNLSEGFDAVLGKMTKGAFEGVKKSLQSALDGIFDGDSLDLAHEFKGIESMAATAFDALGKALSSAISGVLDLVKEFSAWLSENRSTVEAIATAVGNVVKLVLDLAGVVAKLVAGAGDLLVKSGFIEAAMDAISIVVAAIYDTFTRLRIAVGEVGVALADWLVEPLQEALRLLSRFMREIPGIGHSVNQVVLDAANALPDPEKLRKDLEALKSAPRALDEFFKAREKRRAPDTSYADAYDPEQAGRDFMAGVSVGTSTPLKAPAKETKDKPADDARRARKALQDLLRAETEAAVKRAQAVREIESQALDARLEQHLITYRAYLDDKAKLEKSSLDDEMSAQRQHLAQLRAELAHETDDTGVKRLQADIAKAEAELFALSQKSVLIDAKLKLDVWKFERDVADLRVDIRANILDAKGQTLEAALLRLGKETERLLQDRRVAGNAELEALVREQAALSANRLRFDDVSKQAGLVQSSLTAQEDSINREVEAGLRTQLDGERAIRDARLASAAALEESVRAAKELAIASGDPALIAQAIELEQRYRELAGTLDSVAVSINESFFGSIKQGFQDLISGAKSFGDVLKSVISSVLSKLSELALSQLVGNLMSGFGGSGGGLGGLLSAGLSMFGFAEGGAVRGPGTGTSDSILARLSNGEYVLRASAVRALGLDRLNFMNTYGKLPAFATGGLVGGGQGLAGALTTQASAVNANIEVSPTVTIAAGQVADALAKESAFQRAVIAIVGDNGKRIRGAWGT